MFYKNIAPVYNEIFPMNNDTLQLLKENLLNGNIIDVACATGTYVDQLHQLGYNIKGIDISDTMIELASDLCALGDMRNLPNKEYTSIICIGNSLVHLSHEEIKETLKDWTQKLVKDGTIIIQNINFNRIYDKNIVQLPPIKFSTGMFFRNYDLYPNRVLFKTQLIVNHDKFYQEVELTPLEPKYLLKLLQECGLTITHEYGSYTKSSFIPSESYHHIVIAKK